MSINKNYNKIEEFENIEYKNEIQNERYSKHIYL